MVPRIQSDHKDALVEILSNRASLDLFGTEQAFFQNLVASSNLPVEYVRSVSGRWTGNAAYDSRRLLDFAIQLKVNTDDPRFTVLGSLIMALLKQKVPPDEARTLVAVLVAYQLVLDGPTLQSIASRYMVPVPDGAEPAATYGPPLTWRGPTSETELQSFFSPEPAWLDVGFLKRGMQRASSVCRVELGAKSGTGFLVAPTLVLTNFHVLLQDGKEDLQSGVEKTTLRFGIFSLSGGDDEESGRVFKLAGENVVANSPVPELDFALLRVENKILAEESIQPAPLEQRIPAAKSPLNILHHPGGHAMKLSLSGNGVTGVYPETGIIQYVTAATGGSSGSPCFNGDWKVVALHHAQQARAFGSIREGILMGLIYERIKQHL